MIESIPSSLEKLTDVASLKLRVAQSRPLELRENDVLEARQGQIDAEHRSRLASTEFLHAVWAVLANDQIDLPPKLGIDGVELSPLPPSVESGVLIYVTSSCEQTLDDTFDASPGGVDHHVDITGRAGHRVVGCGEGTREHVGNVSFVQNPDDPTEELRQTHGRVPSSIPYSSRMNWRTSWS